MFKTAKKNYKIKTDTSDGLGVIFFFDGINAPVRVEVFDAELELPRLWKSVE